MNGRAGHRIPYAFRCLAAILAFASATNASPCINEYNTLLSGEVVMGEGGHCPLYAHAIDAAELALRLDSLDGLGHVRQASDEELSDRGAALIYLGRYEEALVQYRKLQRAGFDPYTVCANMGTAFELMGQNDSALHYIRKAVDINPGAHEGSEWIHVRILERKIALERGVPVTTPLLGLDLGSGELPSAREGDELRDIRNQLRYQLEERMTFVKAPDPIVGELLFDLGNLEALIWSVECAVDVYAVAKEYGFTSEVFEQRYAKLSGMTGKAALLNTWAPDGFPGANLLTLIALLGCIALIVGLFFLRRRRAR